jgi:predicted ArsR family transcriptional regulator
MAWRRTESAAGAATILRHLEAVPQDVAALAGSLGVHPNTVRKHLERLRRDGLVESELVRSGKVGRPRLAYRAVTPRDGAAAVVAEVLAAHGVHGTVVDGDVVLDHCPLDGHPDDTAAVCARHVGLAEGAAAAHGATVERIMRGGRCAFHVHGLVPGTGTLQYAATTGAHMTEVQNVTRTRKTSFPGGVASFGEGRVCEEPSCETQHSRYNESNRCGVDAPDPHRRVR